MTLLEIDIRTELPKIAGMGFIPTLKPGDTGVGFTLETLLGLRPTNARGVADLTYRGEPVELKAKRRTTSSMLTLFTCEPETRLLSDASLIRRYGYRDRNGREALKITFGAGETEQHGLKLLYDSSFRSVSLVDAKSLIPQWQWPARQLSKKLENLLLVRAAVNGSGSRESFHFNGAVYYRHLDPEQFARKVADGTVVVDLRAHIRPGSSVARNHGTGFRLRNLGALAECYRSAETIL